MLTADHVAVTLDEPLEGRRIRQRPDLMLLLFELLLIALVLLVGKFGVQTASGLESDIHSDAQYAPAFLLSGVIVLTNIATAVIPVGLAIERLVRGDRHRVADAVIAAALAYGICSLLDPHIPIHVYIATLIAYLVTLGFNDRPTLRTFTWSCLAVYATASALSRDAAVEGLVVSFLVGQATAFGWRYLCGVVNERPTGQVVVRTLAETGLVPIYCRWQGEYEDVRRYKVGCADGRVLDVTVLDRDRHAVGLVYRLYRRIRLRGPAQRRTVYSLRSSIGQETLFSYALRDNGIPTPKLVAVRELGSDSVLMAYEHIQAVPLYQLAADDVTDDLLLSIWRTVAKLGRHQIAHRRLALDSILVDDDGRVWLSELRNGEIAAADLKQRLDIAGTMAALALKVGPERTVHTAQQVLGADRVAATLPLLQPVMLTRITRGAVRKSKHLLQNLREQILELRPHASAAEPVKLERLSPKTLLSIAVGCFAVYALMLEISSADSPGGMSLWHRVDGMSPGWLLLAFAAAALTYLSAAFQLSGFIPEKLPLGQNVAVQVASSFVALAAPAAVGSIALNTRYAQKRGIPTGPAVSAVAASQAVGFLVHGLLFAVFSFVVGQSFGRDDSSTVLIAILLTIAFLVMAGTTVPPLRRFAKRRLGPFFEGSVPRLLDVAQSPRKLAEALGGTVSLSLLNSLCLWASVMAVGGDRHHPNYATVTLVFLTVQAATAVVPTPAGMGAVEITMGAALYAAGGGLDEQSAVLAVLVYRILTTYLPALPGRFALDHLRRKHIV